MFAQIKKSYAGFGVGAATPRVLSRRPKSGPVMFLMTIK
jgi:hypothetical protein